MCLNVFCLLLPLFSSLRNSFEYLAVRTKCEDSLRSLKIPCFYLLRVFFNDQQCGCDNSSRIIALARNWRLVFRVWIDMTILYKWLYYINGSRIYYVISNRLGEKTKINKESSLIISLSFVSVKRQSMYDRTSNDFLLLFFFQKKIIDDR